MNVETVVDATRADKLVGDLHRVLREADPALTDAERETLTDTIAFLEDAACIETGERLVQSPMTEREYVATRWIDCGDGRIVALSKRELDQGDPATDGGTHIVTDVFDCPNCGEGVDAEYLGTQPADDHSGHVVGWVCQHCETELEEHVDRNGAAFDLRVVDDEGVADAE